MEEIENKVQEIEAIKENIANFEVNPDDYIDQYDEMLDECYEDFMGSYSTSYTLKCIDETAYRCGLLDYVDSLDISYPTEWDDELSDLLEELEEMIDEDIEILESELEELDNSEDALDEITFYKNQIEYLENIRKEYL